VLTKWNKEFKIIPVRMRRRCSGWYVECAEAAEKLRQGLLAGDLILKNLTMGLQKAIRVS
jgi:hypothetical protein